MSRRILALIALGLAQMVADCAGSNPIKALFAATGASPAPKVFTTYDGLEPFSMRFTLEYRNRVGESFLLPLTAEQTRLAGPYNRRNAYGAALAAAPALRNNKLTQAMVEQVLHYGLCREAPLLNELGVPQSETDGRFIIHYQARTGANEHNLPLSVEVNCS